jgi:hypothetical protein
VWNLVLSCAIATLAFFGAYPAVNKDEIASIVIADLVFRVVPLSLANAAGAVSVRVYRVT